MSTCSGPVIPGVRGSRECGQPVLWLWGDHDLTTCSTVESSTWLVTRFSDGALTLDLSGVTFLDAAIVRVLAGLALRMTAAGRPLQLRAPAPAIERLLRLCGLGDFLTPALDDAPAGRRRLVDVGPELVAALELR